LVHGKPSIFTSVRSCAAALARITPPPVYTIGRFASSSSCAAFLICPLCPFTVGLYERIATESGYSKRQRAVVMSLGMSTTTGPGLPVRAMWNAFFIVTARSRTSLTRKLCFTHGRVIPTVSHSWNASSPIACVGTWPEMTTIGIESMYAVAMPVTALVTPGPEVTRHTPTFSLARE